MSYIVLRATRLVARVLVMLAGKAGTPDFISTEIT